MARFKCTARSSPPCFSLGDNRSQLGISTFGKCQIPWDLGGRRRWDLKSGIWSWDLPFPMGFASSQGWDLQRDPSGWELPVALGFQNPRSQRRWEMARSHEALALGFEAWDLVLGSALRDFEKPLNFSISILRNP